MKTKVLRLLGSGWMIACFYVIVREWTPDGWLKTTTDIIVLAYLVQAIYIQLTKE